jgi:hypothetical protein
MPFNSWNEIFRNYKKGYITVPKLEVRTSVTFCCMCNTTLLYAIDLNWTLQPGFGQFVTLKEVVVDLADLW